jgi:hypothetical protein
MKSHSSVIIWDVFFLLGLILLFSITDVHHLKLIIGFATIQIFTNCIKNHIAAYKLTGKIY